MSRLFRRKAVRLDELRPEIRQVERRLFLQRSLSLGALTLLSGCDLSDNDVTDRVLWAMSRWNDKVQAALFDPNKLAPTYPESAITKPFPYNGYYDEDEAPVIDGAAYKLEVSGLVADKRAWSIADLRKLPQASQITRHICVEGWSAIGKWGGVPFRSFLERVGADTKARYVGFRCADKYYSSIDMATALHPQTLLALDYGEKQLPTKFGYPLKLRVPTKLGFKNPKFIAALFVTNDYPGGYWEDQGYNWFSGS
ncbi:MAG TPA: molybdopterin-dependent oxidoreductase [Candidatus Sulfotelmatobacter sp.]|nr:molybdopterin-dependent oxidoreductase [Candidatus Sulfotelmatobacter sp.]